MRKFQEVHQWIRRYFSAKTVILHYHRIVDLPQDPHILCVKPEHFAEHLAILRHDTHPISLQQLVKSIQEEHLPDRAVVLTFDDGYADNLYHAKPLLQQFGIPATVFIATGYLEGNREFWWDDLERLLLLPGGLPEILHQRIDGSEFHWDIGEAADYQEVAYQRQRVWNIGWQVDPGPRQRLFRSVWELLRSLDEAERCKTLEELATWAGSSPQVRETHRPLLPDEVLRLAEGGNIEVGAHTVTHPVLSALPIARQQDEIQGSKTYLEMILGQPVASFSYPHGLPSDYTAETDAAVREAGFKCACTSLADVVWHGSDPFQLPRILVRDWDGEEFSKRLLPLFHK